MPALVAAAALAAATLVDATTVVPDLLLDLRYATENNFLHKKVYPAARCLLLPDVAARLARAQTRLRAGGLRLKMWDCYRPRSVQWKMWKIYPHEGYVANPRKGSNHNRGAAVDVTVVALDGAAVPVPTEFDTFSENAHAAFPGVPEDARKNRETLRAAMEAEGFRVNPMEWWHYDAPGATRLPVLDEPLDKPRGGVHTFAK
jgi:D-alanyl-D-alanine dipeptidase